MTDREKLIALMVEAESLCAAIDCYDGAVCEYAGEINGCAAFRADHLLANGVTVQRWIPVTERLPEKEDTYLVYTERGSVYSSHVYTEMKFASGYVREASWSQRGKVKVTHWMPLPQPPKEGE